MMPALATKAVTEKPNFCEHQNDDDGDDYPGCGVIENRTERASSLNRTQEPPPGSRSTLSCLERCGLS
jgi:hypothetical protein